MRRCLAKPSPSLRDAPRTETLRERETRRRAERGVSKTERVGKAYPTGYAAFPKSRVCNITILEVH